MVCAKQAAVDLRYFQHESDAVRADGHGGEEPQAAARVAPARPASGGGRAITRARWSRGVTMGGRVAWLSAGAVLGLALLAPGAIAATEPRSVLLIYADPRLTPGVVAIDETLRAAIESGVGEPVQFYTEYLDLAWFPRGQERYIGGAMREKY